MFYFLQSYCKLYDLARCFCLFILSLGKYSKRPLRILQEVHWQDQSSAEVGTVHGTCLERVSKLHFLLHLVAMYYITFCITFYCNVLHYILYYIWLQCFTLHFVLHFIAIYYITFYCNVLHYILYYILLQCITLHFLLHFIALHYI